MHKYTLSYRKNDKFSQEIIVNAESRASAVEYFIKTHPGRTIIGISETVDRKPGRPEITVPEDK